MSEYRAVVLVDCPTETDLVMARGMIDRLVEAIETKTDGATIQIFGPTKDVRAKDIHTLADEMFG